MKIRKYEISVFFGVIFSLCYLWTGKELMAIHALLILILVVLMGIMNFLLGIK